MSHVLTQDTHEHTVRFFLADSLALAAGKSGFSASSNRLRVAFVRDNDARTTPISLSAWKDGQHVPGAFREVDKQLMPGLYELQLPDELAARGARRATLMITAEGIEPCVIHFDLVAYDPYDSHALGLDCLSRDHRHATITSAFREVVPDIVEEFMRRVQPK